MRKRILCIGIIRDGKLVIKTDDEEIRKDV